VAGQFFEDGATGGVGESAEDVVGVGLPHKKTITKWLWFVKRGSGRVVLAVAGWNYCRLGIYCWPTKM
jgi:hypothetical protein